MSGCSHNQKTSTFMITRDEKLYALYNNKGEDLTDFDFKSYIEVKDFGYIVTDVSDNICFIDLEGDQIVFYGVYKTLEPTDHMLYATKEVAKEDAEKKEETTEKTSKKSTKTTKKKDEAKDLFVYDNLYVLNDKGDVLYEASQDVGILKSGLPIIKRADIYTVLKGSGQELYIGKDVVSFAYEQDGVIIVGYDQGVHFYYENDENEKKNFDIQLDVKGDYRILAVGEKAAIINDEKNHSMIYINLEDHSYEVNTIQVDKAEIEDNNIYLYNEGTRYAYSPKQEPIELKSYYASSTTYLVRSTDIYGPHGVYKYGKKVADLKDIQLYPVSEKINSEIFPVYVRDKGYQFYNFDGKKAIEKYYIEAQPFDENNRAIVKEDDKGYVLIDDKGQKMNENVYHAIKYIGGSYYAVYNETGIFGILNQDGEEVLPIEYISFPKQAVVQYEGYHYLILNKNGRSYVYDIEQDMTELFSVEGEVTFNEEKGYFIAGYTYYTYEGDIIE